MTTPKYPTSISASELAGWLGVTTDHLAELAGKGHVVRTSHGKYQLRESVAAYCRYQRYRADGLKSTDKARADDDPRRRIDEAKARIAEAEASELERELIRVNHAVAIFTDMVSNARSRLLSLECRVPPEARIATKQAVHDALTELSQYDQTELIAQLREQNPVGVGATSESDDEPMG